MAIRKAYIDWKRLDKSSKLESGKVYMVFMLDNANHTGAFGFATYYKKGDVVKLRLREDYRPGLGAETEEQRLLDAIFGRNKTYIVPMDGLYQQTGDYGVDEKCENGAFKGCAEQLVPAGNTLNDDQDGAIPVFWAECPVVPQGYNLIDDVHAARTIDGDAMGDLRAKLDASKAAMYVYQGLCGHSQDKQARLPGDDGNVNVYVKGGICSVTPGMAATLVLGVHGAATKLAAVPDDELKSVAMTLTQVDSRETGARMWNNIREKYGLTVKESSYALMILTFLSDTQKGFYECRNKLLAARTPDSLDTTRIVIEAYGKSHLPMRLGRLRKLYALNAPEIILFNELRMACEIAAAWKFSNLIVHVTQDFANYFGINPDGTRSETCTEVGDMELYTQYLKSQECDHKCDACDVAYCDERDGPLPDDIAPADPDEDKNLPRYSAAYMPNFMMRVPGVCIVDNETNTFLRDDDGNIETWTECPRDRLDELNAIAK